MRKILATLLILAMPLAAAEIRSYRLDNGLKLLVKEDHRAPIAVSMLWYDVGSSDEPGGITGISHAIEHMMFKGTPNYPVGAFSKLIASKGGQDNAFTNNDYTAFFEKIAAKELPLAFKLEADRMQNLLISAEEFEKEIKVIQEERRMRTDDNPQALSFERFLAAAHLSSPYQHPVIGWMSDLKNMQSTDLRAWYERYYAPNNAQIIVVGDVSAEAVFKLAKQYFGPIKMRPIPKRHAQTEPPRLGKKSIELRMGAKLPMFLLGYTVPTVVSKPNSFEPYALEIITSILDAGPSARFSKRLIRGTAVATGADAFYNLYARYQTQFIIYGSPSQNHSIKELRAALLEEVNKLKEQKVSLKELERVKHQIIAQKTFEKDSIFSQAMELGLLQTLGLGYKASDRYIDQIKQITPEQIQSTALRYFQSQGSTEASLIPQEEEKKS